jgi:hypothetical protein
MQFHSLAASDGVWLQMIGWLYLLTNATRVITYVPQIVVVWRCTDGAMSVSLLTWCSWVLSHVAATAYGLLLVHDVLFVAISLINLAGCGAVAMIAARRRVQWKRQEVGGVALAVREDG